MRRLSPIFMVLVLASVLLGMAVVGEGFPSSFYADERVNIQRCLYFGAVSSLNPGYFNKPALSYYCGFVAYGVVYAVGRISGVFSGAEDFGVWTIDHEHVLLLVGRIVVALSGLFAVFATWWLARKFVGKWGAIFASLLVATSPAWIESSSVIKEDVLSAAFFTISIACMVETSRTGSWRDAARAGFFGGLSMATKYYAVALVAPAMTIAAVVAFSPARPGETRSISKGTTLMGVGAILFFVGFFIGSPYNFLDPAFYRDHVEPGLHSMSKLVGLGGWLSPKSIFEPQNPTLFVDPNKESVFSLLGYAISVLASATTVGLGACLFAIAGITVAFVRRNRDIIGLSLGTLGVLLVITAANRQHASPRHLLVLIPCLAVLAAVAWEAVLAWISKRYVKLARRESIVMMASVLVVMALPSPGGAALAETISVAADGVTLDARLEAQRWIEKEIPRGATVLSYNEGIPLLFSEARCNWALEAIPKANRVNMATHQKGYDSLWKIRKLAAQRRSGHDLDLILFEAPWQGSDEAAIETSKVGYNPLWMERFPARPERLAPVERLTQAPKGARTPEVEAAWPVLRWLREGTAIQFLVILDIGDANFDRSERRAAYPSFAAFFDDLHGHYDAWQWTDRGGAADRTVRVYDLRNRVMNRLPARREMLPSSGE